jgi:ribonuclease G
MKKEIIINSTLNETRIALTEDRKLVELFIELPDQERTISNIFLGRVTKVAQGINAAFVNIGQNQDAFLHFSDLDESHENILTDEDDEDEKQNGKKASSKNKAKTKKKTNLSTFKTKKLGNFEINLKQGQDIIVQIVREAYGTKGVRVTTKIGIPGRYVVLLPFENMIGVSKKIESYKERRRLRYLAKNSLPKGMGCIIRTAAVGKNENELKKDWENLVNTWKIIDEKIKKSEPPTLVYQDMELATSIIRDLFTKDVHRVFVDTKKLFKEIQTYVKWFAPNLANKIELYQGKTSIFDHFGIEKELESTYKPKVNLPGGGSIVIEQTEAMFVIDVNSGRSMGDQGQEMNAMNTNMEAAKEIARQIRIRDVSGLIIIDYIDLIQDKFKKKLYYEMKKEMNKDRAKSVVYPLTQLCLMQITRKRINQYITEKITEICPMCNGSGRIASKAVLLNSIERWLKQFRSKSKEFRVILEVHPHVAAYLAEGTISRLTRLMIKYFIKIKVKQNEHIHFDKFKFYSVRKNKEITHEYK